MEAAGRRAQRDAERRQRLQQKANMISEAADAVAEWEDVMSDLVSIHDAKTTTIDWAALTKAPAPLQPQATSSRELIAISKIEAFKPSVFDFLRGGSDRRLARLQMVLDTARAEDERDNQLASNSYKIALSEWESDRALAKRILDHDPAAFRDVISEMQTLSSEGLIGSNIEFNISQAAVHAIAKVHDDSIVPRVRRKQLASGKLSESKMPAGDFNEHYQDYVSSVALRIAGDLYAILPINEIYVTCSPEILDTKTGYKRFTPIISVKFVRETFNKLNLSRIDPSDALRNFVHRMDFKRTRGFAEVDPLMPLE
ncbi:hypothetical protein [Sphingosinithalassobacter portus]|uniref:hypothetical protein n=1 Tax=Stakelama portus TaxID=2676234 RepID=UPI0011AB8688|nr:hypothetical protein [Sphingosinithalassobacter portus]